MKDGLLPGINFCLHFLVTPEMAPRFHDGPPVHPVLSTWSLVHQMEVAGRLLLEPFLEEHEEGVGGGIEIVHRSPALIGTQVNITATVESLEEGRLWTRVDARAGSRLLANGRFLQVVLPKSELARLFERCRTDIDE